MNELTDLFLSELADIYNAENQLIKALPKMAKAAQSEELREAFENHLAETEQHAERLKQVFESFDKTAKSKKCHAMEGLVEEAKEIISDNKGDITADAALISAAQKVEHYEMATYGTLCCWAKLLGNQQALSLLKENMSEEEKADKLLNQIASSQSNLKATRRGMATAA
ncbi:MAG TPA: ferritin-like domain-containing protein [Verrucomicrobiae bacterium]|jgi:ferritin-like metal-binding protein YciE